MDEALVTAITTGFTDMAATITQVVLIGVPIMIGAMGVKRGALFALNFLKGIFSRT